jgi:hypothetical protein
MPSKLESPTTKISLRLFSNDHELLKKYYPAVGYNEIIRSLVHRHVKKLEQKTQQHLEDPELLSHGDLNVR